MPRQRRAQRHGACARGAAPGHHGATARTAAAEHAARGPAPPRRRAKPRHSRGQRQWAAGLAQAARHATTAPPPRHCLYAVHNGMPCLCLHASPRSMPPLHAKRSMSNRRRSRAPARGAVLPAARRGRARAGGAASWCGLPSGTRSRNTVSSGKPNARAARSTTSGPFSGLTPTCAHGAGGRWAGRAGRGGTCCGGCRAGRGAPPGSPPRAAWLPGHAPRSQRVPLRCA